MGQRVQCECLEPKNVASLESNINGLSNILIAVMICGVDNLCQRCYMIIIHLIDNEFALFIFLLCWHQREDLVEGDVAVAVDLKRKRQIVIVAGLIIGV